MLSRCLCAAVVLLTTLSGAGCGTGPTTLPSGGLRASAASGPAAHRKSALGLPSEVFGPCPQDAVFVRIFSEIRGYPLSASGPTAPCTDIIGDQTLLTGNGNGYGSIAISINGNLHALAFQSNAGGGLLIFLPNAAGNATPSRAVAVSQDHVALAVDSHVNDYVVASENYAGDNCWYVVPIGTLAATASNCDASVSAIYALAVTPKD